jgi:uncharacterized membrane protein YvlD (DUF360 family)
MYAIRTFLRAFLRFLVIWVLSAVSLMITDWLLPGISLNAIPPYSQWVVALAAAFVLGLVNLLVRPLILLLAVPLGFIVLFVAGFFINAVMLRITANLMDGGLVVDGWLPAILGGIVIASVGAILSAILGVEDAGAFYEGVIERRLARQRAPLPENPTTGLVMLEIDGLSYHHIRKAIDAGYMPNVKQMIEQEGYVLSHTDCGLPSQTSACQTGILFGDNHDIPAFRWYDKAQNRLFVSGNDAAEINARYAHGQGLLRGGASINNMMNGDARLSLLTASDLRGGTSDQQRARAQDVYLLLLNPNFFMRVLGLFIGESILEVYQYTRDVLANTQPRLNRLHHFYPFIRSATTVFMREVSGFLTIMQIVRGEPVMYTTWPGYDEVAHHSGPWSKYAFGTLRGFDRFIGIVREMIVEKAPRPYELILLSDHGQSFGPTFLMRYGYTLKEYIQRHMPEGTVMIQTSGGDDGSIAVASTAAELGNIQAQGMGGRVSQSAAKQMQKAAVRSAEANEEEVSTEAVQAADVTFCGSGNLAQIYFHALKERATLNQLKAEFPGMVEAVIAHEGVGVVVANDDNGVPIAYGKGGARNLHTGEVSGEDPLLPYGDLEVRAWQLRRVADFPSAGDLIAISTVYPDGTVAAMEELIGNHGGMGGEQTDSFLLHPADMVVPPTRSSVDMFALLDARRERPAPVGKMEELVLADEKDEWSPGYLLNGLRRPSVWGGLALRAAILDRLAYRTIADTGAMTGPALLLSLLGAAAHTLAEAPPNATGLLMTFAGRYVLWLIAVAVLHAAARILRGQATFTQSFRVLGFAQVISLLTLLQFIEPLAPLVAAGVAVLSAFAAWLAMAEAHRFRGWRTLALPLLYFAILVIGSLALLSLFGGFEFAVDTLSTHFGLRP